MKRIKLYIAVSLDGYIARTDGSLDWLIELPYPTYQNHDFNDLMNSIDTIIMGGKTYHEFMKFCAELPYKDKTTYVVARHNTNLNEADNVIFITENVIERISDLKKESGKDIWLVGGGKIITTLLNRSLIDEMQICYIPLILGKGIPLFPDNPKESKWKLTGKKVYESGILKVVYQREK